MQVFDEFNNNNLCQSNSCGDKTGDNIQWQEPGRIHDHINKQLRWGSCGDKWGHYSVNGTSVSTWSYQKSDLVWQLWGQMGTIEISSSMSQWENLIMLTGCSTVAAVVKTGDDWNIR